MAEQFRISGSSAAEISTSIECGVRLGEIDPGAVLPPVRVLASELHVSPATVAKAYSELRRRGIVEADGRRGTRVRSRPPVADPRSTLRVPVPTGILDLSTGEPDMSLLPPLGPALVQVADKLGPPIGYAKAGAMPELVEATRLRLASDGIPVDEASITVTAGTLDAIERLLTVHLRPGDSVAVEDPGWANLYDLLAALNVRAVPMAVDEEGPLPEALSEALRSGVGAVIVTTRAQNPTGSTVSARRADQLRHLLRGHADVLVIEDDNAADLVDVLPNCLGPVTGRWAYVRSASKPFGPDLRIALLTGDEATIARVVGRMWTGLGWVSTILQRLLLRLWQDPQVTTQIATAATSYDHRRLGLVRELSARGQPAQGSTGLNVWVRVPDETRAVSVLRDAGYAVSPGSLFRIASPPGIRITVSALTDRDIEPLSAAILAAANPAATATPSR
ncbi:aminotransferase class I/II-fold pyridoxal phosphate-dependent enzyme [Actinoplanes sp. M2I2]|uniref:aminotransferase class I/II-fold pyridoxal phosphate-dependent enzyme n=1 Tax=Actinoplanes sp. M2I2 TaxID=1734444 RepID=UPI002021D92D|nr:aminotransferase class I/II-fold pyridoxal phosphate-dependent enzyme [Actinoplanes sp. M2I2]